MMFNIRVTLEIPGSKKLHEGFILTGDGPEAERSKFSKQEAIIFASKQLERPEFVALLIVPAE